MEQTVQAIQVTQYGGPEVLELSEVPIPEPGPGQVRIKVTATSVNFADIQGRKAPYHTSPPPPFIPGLEATGMIDAIGPGVSGFEPGQRVAGLVDGGSYAEYVLARTIGVYAVPDNVEPREAAVFSSVGTTAYNLLTLAARIQPGEAVLIHAAAGGVGSTAVQLARLLGAARIIGTVGSAEKADLIRSLGADEAINYREENVSERVMQATRGAGVDVILDAVGKDTFEASLASLALHGRLVVYGQSSGPPPAFEFGPLFSQNKAVIGYSTGGHRRSRPEVLRPAGLAVLKLLAAGRWKPVIDRTLPLAQAGDAQHLVETRATMGKVVLEI
jgi:NADPH:quinone reductase